MLVVSTPFLSGIYRLGSFILNVQQMLSKKMEVVPRLKFSYIYGADNHCISVNMFI